jgi:peptidoglycan/LPS O-acetylase OafA/YrhL
MSGAAARRGRLRSLDVLRALAVLLVLGRHMPDANIAEGGPLRVILQAWERGGWVGVDLFFVLSGFLVSGLLFREHRRHGEIRLLRFLARRGFKIYPAFYAMLGITVFMRWALGALPPWRGIVSEALFIQNYLEPLWSHSWSLAVEEHFYLVVGLLLWLASRRGGEDPFRRFPLLFVGVALLLLGLRVLTAWQRPFDVTTHLYPTHLRADSLLFGVLLAYWRQRDPVRLGVALRRHRHALLAVSLLLVAPPFFVDLQGAPALYTVGLAALYLGFGALLLLALELPLPVPTGGWGAPLRAGAAALARVGFDSYSIYLWHMPFQVFVLPRVLGLLGIEPGGWLELALYLLGAVLMGIAMARAVEQPFLRLRDRLIPSRSPAMAASPARGSAP